MSVSFNLDARTDSNGDAPIRASIYIRGQRLVTTTGQKINPAKWDTARQRARKGSINAAGVAYNVINSVLTRIIESMAAYETECITMGIKPDTDEIRARYASEFGRKKGSEPPQKKRQTFFDALDCFITEEATNNQWSTGTVKKFRTLYVHLNKFNPETSFDSLTEAALNEFITYLRDTAGLRNSTIQKTIALLRWFLKWAARKGLNDNRTFLYFTPKMKNAGRKVHFLEWAELMNVYRLEIPENGTIVTLTDATGKDYTKTVADAAALEKTRNIFCFCCFTSLRYSDALNLKWADIGPDTLTITTIKTNDTITIDLNKYARAILDKYRDWPEAGGYVFPRITNQRMNIYIKTVCELAGLNTMITTTYYRGNERIEETRPKWAYIGTHAGRRTFICNALILGIPPQVVMKWTGHSDYKAMKPYIDITNAAKAEAMAKFDEL